MVSIGRRAVYVVVLLAVSVAMFPGSMALFGGWGLHYKTAMVLAALLAGCAAYMFTLRVGLVDYRGIVRPCPPLLRSPLGTASLVGLIGTLVAAALMSPPMDLFAPVPGGVAAILYLIWASRRAAILAKQEEA